MGKESRQRWSLSVDRAAASRFGQWPASVRVFIRVHLRSSAVKSTHPPVRRIRTGGVARTERLPAQPLPTTRMAATTKPRMNSTGEGR